MSARSTTWPSARQTYCCLSRDLSVRCSMLKEMPLLRAPENKRTGMEMSPKVKCPDQTDAAIIPLVHETSTVLCHSDQAWRNLLFLDRAPAYWNRRLTCPELGV